MPTPKATKVNLSEEERKGLEQLVRRHNIGQQIALRARIILAAGQGQTNTAIAATLKVNIITAQLGNWYKKGPPFQLEKQHTDHLFPRHAWIGNLRHNRHTIGCLARPLLHAFTRPLFA